MQKIKKLIFEDRIYNLSKDEEYIVYIVPVFNKESLFNYVIPSMAINNEEKPLKAVIVGNMTPEGIKRDKHINTYINEQDIELNSDLLSRTKAVVFPFLSIDITETIKMIKEHKKDIKIIYHVTLDFLNIPEWYNLRSQYTRNEKNIINNIKASDICMFNNKYLKEKIFLHVRDNSKEPLSVKFINMPLFTSETVYEDIEEPKEKKKKDVIHIGVMAEELYTDVFNDEKDQKKGQFINVLRKLKEKHKEKIKIIIIGQKSDEFDCIYDYDNFTYYQQIANLNLDIACIYTKNSVWNKGSMTNIDLLIFNSMYIPVAVSNREPFNEYVKHNENGVFCANQKEWLEELEFMITDNFKLSSTKKAALEKSWNTYSIDNANIFEYYMQMFKL